MVVTYYGHSCFSVKAGGKTLLFDPFITGNDLAKGIDVSKIEADYILISHGHEDHIADAVKIARQSNAKIISNFEITTVYFPGANGENSRPVPQNNTAEAKK